MLGILTACATILGPKRRPTQRQKVTEPSVCLYFDDCWGVVVDLECHLEELWGYVLDYGHLCDQIEANTEAQTSPESNIFEYCFAFR